MLLIHSRVRGAIMLEDCGKLRLKPNDIRDFWEHLSEHTSWAAGHPGKKLAANPIGIYGDDARYTKSGDKFTLLHVNALLSSSSSRTDHEMKRFPLLAIREFITYPSTLRPVYAIFAWSFNCLLSGLHPTLSYAGEPYHGRKQGKIAGQPSAKPSSSPSSSAS